MTEYEPIFFDIETTGLNPMAQHWWKNTAHAARVTAIGIGQVKGWREAGGHEDCTYDMTVLWDSSEYNLLQVALKRMNEYLEASRRNDREPFLVGFNSRQFDHPYLGARFARLRLDGTPFNHGEKRLDMMRALGKHLEGVKRYPGEQDCLKVVGIESQDEFTGKDMPDAFANKEWDKIKTHVEHDVKDMMRLFVETREECMREFYDHYNVDADATFAEVYEP